MNRCFIVVNDTVIYFRDDNEREINDAKEELANLGETSAIIHHENGKCGGMVVKKGADQTVLGETPVSIENGATFACSRYDNLLVARQFVAIPYTKTYADDHGETTYCLFYARDAKHAIELISSRGGSTMNDACWWSKEANKLGDTAERSDANCHYMMWSCDCGDDGCNDEKRPHDSQTETIIFGFDAAVCYPTRDAAVQANNDREPAVEYLET